MKVLALGFGAMIVALLVCALTGVGVVERTRSLDIHSGQEMVVVDVLGIPVNRLEEESAFYMVAKGEGLVTQGPQWRVCARTSWPSDPCRLSMAGYTREEITRLGRAFDEQAMSRELKRAWVGEVLALMGSETDFKLDYDDQYKVVGVNGKRVVP